jgi:hypothetical protein
LSPRWRPTSTDISQNRLAPCAPGGQYGRMSTSAGDTITLWRPTGPEELALVRASGWREWPPRLPGQPIFYPVLNEDYATKIARDWNVPHSGSGYVTRFRVRRAFLDGYQVHQAGGKTILEYWIPSDDLPGLNASIVGLIEVTAEYHQSPSR